MLCRNMLINRQGLALTETQTKITPSRVIFVFVLNYKFFLFLFAILAFLIASLLLVFLEREVLFLVFTAIRFAIILISYTKTPMLAIVKC